MRTIDPFDYTRLAKQITYQKKLQWDLEEDINWSQGIDISKPFLPLGELEDLFPGASMEQFIALSQWFGIIANCAAAEVESVQPDLKKIVWKDVLDSYPVNPEMYELGEMFFEEEAKHVLAFSRYQDVFCAELGIDKGILDLLVPKLYGSFFQSAIRSNAMVGGHIFWWVVAEAEELGIATYKNIQNDKDLVDPLFYELHRKHLEEEARHENYPHLMLNLLSQKPQGLKQIIHKKVDFILAQLVGGPWVLQESLKIMRVKEFKNHHPFFNVLASCLPLLQKLTYSQRIRYFFFMAPYISWKLNPAWKKRSNRFADRIGALKVPSFNFLQGDSTSA